MTRCRGAILAIAMLALIPLPVCALRNQQNGAVKAIVDKAVQAIGGEEKLGKIRAATWSAKARATVRGKVSEVTLRQTVQGLDHFRQVLSTEGRTGISLLVGDKFVQANGPRLIEMPRKSTDGLKRSLYRAVVPMLITPLRMEVFKVTTLPEEKFDGKPAAGLLVIGPDGSDFKLYFDKESGLPVRMVEKVDYLGQLVNHEVLYSDYKEMDGIKIASKIRSTLKGTPNLDQETTDFKILKDVDPKLFTEP